MEIDKKVINLIRNGLKKEIKKKTEELTSAKESLKKALSSGNLLRLPQYTFEEKDKKMLTAAGYTVDKDTISSIKVLKLLIDYVEKDLRRLQTLLNAVSIEGIHEITYNLPFLGLSCGGYNLSYSYLMLMGIKTNAELKDDESVLIDPVERENLNFERQLAKYIKDDYTIDLSDVKDFMEIYLMYYLYFFDKRGLHSDEFETATIVDAKLITMLGYIIYSKTGVVLNREKLSIMCADYRMSVDVSIEKPVGSTLEKICLNEIERLKKSTPIQKEEAIVPKSENESGSITYDITAIEPYLENGIVTYPCNLEEFELLLQKTILPEERKREYYLQMKNLINRNVEAEYNRRMEACKKSNLTFEEQDLYNRGRENLDAKPLIESIDTILEMLILGVSEEERDLLMDELSPLFNELKIIFTPQVEEEIPKLLYYTDPVKIGRKTVQIPRILKGIVDSKKESYKQAYTHLNKLLLNMTTGDREVKGDNFPCKVWSKGRDFKIFYTTIGEVIVVIDGGKGEQAFKEIGNTVTSPNFNEFLKATHEHILNGEPIDASDNTKLIMGELEKSTAVKKINLIK